MALAVDSSSPAVARGATSTTTTASFSPPALSLLVAYVQADENTGSTDEQCTVTSTGGLSWSLAIRANGAPGATVEVWYAFAVSAPGSITVSCTDNKGAVDKSLFVRVYTDGAGLPAGIGATGSSGTLSASYTSTVANSWGWGAGLGGGAQNVTAGSGQTLQDSLGSGGFDGGDDIWTVDQNSTTATAGTTVTMSVTGPSITSHAVAVEILPAAMLAAPRRSTQTREQSPAPWLQRDRRDANTVSQAANPLPAPLDSAWQAGGLYWHLYGDAADAAARTWSSYQRPYVSDPSLLGAAPTDPLTLAAGVGGDLWRRYNTGAYTDRREVPAQRAYVSNPALLATALLENELLGGADLGRRYATPATHADRREVPQQRAYVSDPLLLTTALLEDVLLGCADEPKRRFTPATHAPRWWMPQQPRRDAYSPGLLDTAQLENELLGGADDLRRRYLTPATHVDRRQVPQQPPRWTLWFDAGPDVPPLTLSWGAGGRYWALYNTAALQPDRRQVPQQRAYVSDPSFYPLIPPTDPLTVAWGADGVLWALYNTAALQPDRRQVPQQRAYVSDPGLLATALLETPLLGGADDTRRRYAVPATHADRRQAGQQPLRVWLYVTAAPASAPGSLNLTTVAATGTPSTAAASHTGTTSSGTHTTTTTGGGL